MRYTLRDRTMLQRIMRHPGRGTPYSIRTLAEASGCSKALIEHLHSGRREDCDMAVAHKIAEAVGVAVLVLFMPPVSPEQNTPSTD